MKALEFDVCVPRCVPGKAMGTLYGPHFWSGLPCLSCGDVAKPVLPGPDPASVKTHHGGGFGGDRRPIHLHSSSALHPTLSDFPDNETVLDLGAGMIGLRAIFRWPRERAES